MSVAARIGKVLAGKYHIDALIGRGGMGLVFAATHRLTQEQVAVKFVRDELLGDEQTKRRFVKEAQIVASLKHPNVVRLIDLDEDQELGLYMVLELLQGESLQDRLLRDLRIDLRELCEILLPVMHAISDAHARDILHRDLKPANIFLHRERDGRTTPKLLDFGIVRMMSSKSGLGTKTGQPLGTPSYMSPEQAQGLKELGPATDVWSMGVAIYECLSGKEPFDRGSPEGAILAAASGDYRALPEVCPELPRAAAVQAVIARALSVEPAQRTPSMRQLMVELAAVAEIEPAVVLAAHGLRWATPSDRPEAAAQAEPIPETDLAALPQVLDPSQLPPPANFQRITTGLALALFVIAALLVGSALRRESPPGARGSAGSAAPAAEPAEEEPLPGIMPEADIDVPAPPPAKVVAGRAAPAPKKRGHDKGLDLGEILVR